MPDNTPDDLVIDAHCHIGRGLSAEELIEMMDEAGVGKAVVFVTPVLWGLPGQADYQDTNDFIADMQRKHPDRLIGFGLINPYQPVEELGSVAPTDTCEQVKARGRQRAEELAAQEKDKELRKLVEPLVRDSRLHCERQAKRRRKA